jgi:serine/threonine protein phosphatase PrpC
MYPHFTFLFCNTSSLGDAVAHTAGVISDPEFTEKELHPASDRVIVVATDGLWEFIENDETIELMNGTPSLLHISLTIRHPKSREVLVYLFIKF